MAATAATTVTPATANPSLTFGFCPASPRPPESIHNRPRPHPSSYATRPPLGDDAAPVHILLRARALPGPCSMREGRRDRGVSGAAARGTDIDARNTYELTASTAHTGSCVLSRLSLLERVSALSTLTTDTMSTI